MKQGTPYFMSGSYYVGDEERSGAGFELVIVEDANIKETESV